MTLITKPDFTYIWASGGAVVAPNDTKKQLGWVAEAPPFQWDNWLQNRQDQMLAHINQRGIPAWDALTNYEAGSLSYVQGSDGNIYRSVAASGPVGTVQNPTTDTTNTYWVAFIASTPIGTRYFSVAGVYTYTPTVGTKSIIVEIVGGGGAGGGAPTTGAGSGSLGGGGGAGLYSKKLITSGFSGVTVTVGAGGVAGISTGGNGGTTSFGAIFSATGGLGGNVAGASGGNFIANGGAGGVSGAGTPDFSVWGGIGGVGLGYYSSTGIMIGGSGGTSYFGAGGNGSANNVGGVGQAPGSGGGGSSNLASLSARVGGVGATGVVIITEFL